MHGAQRCGKEPGGTPCGASACAFFLLQGRGLQLPAGRVNVLALALADDGRDAGIPENLFKGQHPFLAGRLVGRARGRIVDNEVDLALAHGAHDADELASLLRAVIDVAQQEVFEGDAFPGL